MKGCCLLACVADCLVAEKNSLEFGAINGQVLTDRREGGRIHFAPLQSALKNSSSRVKLGFPPFFRSSTGPPASHAIKLTVNSLFISTVFFTRKKTDKTAQYGRCRNTTHKGLTSFCSLHLFSC